VIGGGDVQRFAIFRKRERSRCAGLQLDMIDDLLLGLVDHLHLFRPGSDEQQTLRSARRRSC
jgi:hypothetical protein